MSYFPTFELFAYSCLVIYKSHHHQNLADSKQRIGVKFFQLFYLRAADEALPFSESTCNALK